MKSNGKPEEVASRIDLLVADYIKVRTRLGELKEDYEKEIQPLKAVKDELAAAMLAFLDQTGQEMARTDEGTVYATVRHTASCPDPDIFMEFVAQHGFYDLLDRRPNATACRDHAEEYGTLPPGVKIHSTRTVGVRS
jgi:hypothetical protein